MNSALINVIIFVTDELNDVNFCTIPKCFGLFIIELFPINHKIHLFTIF
jgi:hypothetical protein